MAVSQCKLKPHKQDNIPEYIFVLREVTSNIIEDGKTHYFRVGFKDIP